MPKKLISSVLIDLRDFAERSGLAELALDLERVRLRHLSVDPLQPRNIQRHRLGDNVVIELSRPRPDPRDSASDLPGGSDFEGLKRTNE